jgi:ketosteroid isomerase-like protein
MSEPAENLVIARRYLQALERGATGAELGSFFAPEVILDEFPNRVVPLGKRRGLAEAQEGAERGKKIMSRQIYKITREMADQDRVALEVEWVGTLAAAFGTIPAGGQMKAFLAVFLDFRDGKIIKQRNYDCYESW